MPPKLYTTREAATAAGISRQTLQAWIAAKKVKAPQTIKAGIRLWTEADVAKLSRVERRSYPRKTKSKSK